MIFFDCATEGRLLFCRYWFRSCQTNNNNQLQTDILHSQHQIFLFAIYLKQFIFFKINEFFFIYQSRLYQFIIFKFINNMNKALSARRRQKDIFKLRSADYKVEQTEQNATYHVDFMGPANTPYEKGHWIINLYLPEEYPYKSPSVGFLNKIYHPNIDFGSGSVCLDVINQTWTPMYELVNIFEIFLPQLLTYPNPLSPLNHEAAELYEKNIEQFNKKVREYILKYALNKSIKQEQPLGQPQIEQQESSFQQGSCSLSDPNSLIAEDDQLALY